MSTTWKWLAGVFLGLLAAIALLYFLITKKKGAADLAVSLVEAAHAAKIKELQAQIDALSQDTNAHIDEIKKLETELAKKKEKLKDVYVATGMSAEEQAKHFENLKI